MEEIIVIRATDPDGSVFKAVMDALSGKRAEVVDVAEQSASVLRIGDLEIYCNQHRAFTQPALPGQKQLIIQIIVLRKISPAANGSAPNPVGVRSIFS